MRRIPAHIDSKLRSTRQTKAANADPSLDLWIGRPTTPLVDETFMERQTVPVSGGGITRTDIAVAHPIAGKGNTQIHVAFVQNGVAKVVKAAHKTRMDAHVWADTGFYEPADDVAIAYDGTMPKATSGYEEFKTSREPWVFWVDNGTLYARHMNTNEPDVTLAEDNCTAVTAVRAMWSEVGQFDFGLVVFFLLAGSIYYRQLIDGEWKDAELVSFGPPGVSYADIVANRTWDYRVALQAKTAGGAVYELFTQFAGVAKQNTEHIEIKSVAADGGMTAVDYIDAKHTDEHIEIQSAQNDSLWGGFYSTLPPVILSVENIPTEVEGEEEPNWGLRVKAVFSAHLNPDSAAESFGDFTLVDANNVQYVATGVEESENGLEWVFTLPDFNNAAGVCRFAYNPGTLNTMADTVATAAYLDFEPQNLVPSAVPAPQIVEVYND